MQNEILIHPSAIVDSKATLGRGVKIGPFSIIGPDVVLGDFVEVKSHVVIEGKTTIGESTKIYPFASLGQAPQIFKYHGEKSEVIIGKNNIIREYVTIQAGSESGGMITSIGSNCLFMVGSHIGHDCHIGNNVVLANYASIAGHVVIEDFVVIGGLVGVHQYVKIGTCSMIAGFSGLRGDLIPYAMALGSNAKVIGLNLTGLKRRGFDRKMILEALSNLREIFSNSSYSFSEKINILEKNSNDNRIIRGIFEFLATKSKRNFCEFEFKSR